MSNLIFYTPKSLHRHYPTRRKLRKFKKRYRKQNARRFGFFIAEYRHVDLAVPRTDKTVEMIFFKRQPGH